MDTPDTPTFIPERYVEPVYYKGLCVGGPYAGRQVTKDRDAFQCYAAPRMEAPVAFERPETTHAICQIYTYRFMKFPWGHPRNGSITCYGLWMNLELVKAAPEKKLEQCVMDELVRGYHPDFEVE